MEANDYEISYESTTNWKLAGGFLLNSIKFESSFSSAADNDGEDENVGAPAARSPLVLFPPSPDSESCEITNTFAQKHELRQVYVRSTARVYEIYYATKLQRNNDYLCAVRCGTATRDEEVLQAPVIEEIVSVNPKEAIKDLEGRRVKEVGMEMKQRKHFGTATSSAEDDPDLFKEEDAVAGSSKWDLFGSPRRIFGFCLAVRIINALLIQTYFNPDEHWQSLEVSHRIVFGYGHLTWEWKKGIRSYLHPLVFALLYKVLALLGLDTPHIMIKAPRLLQSTFSAVGDVYLYKLSDTLYGKSVAKWSLFSQLANWFMFFCFNRTFSNCLETVLTLVGLYYWPCVKESSRKFPRGRKWGLAIAALACAIRPTSAIIWLYVGMFELFLTRDKLRFIILEVIPIGMLVLGFTCLLDRLMYGSWVIVPLNFLKFNFLSSGGDYYGTHPWHWYFTQGFSVMLFTFAPFSFAGIIKSKNLKLSCLILWVLALYSVLGHKEFRFVLPVLPIASMFSGYALADMEKPGSSRGKHKGSLRNRTKWSPKLRFSILFLLATNIPMALYMSLVHQRGTEDVMNYLSTEAHNGKVKSVLFLMPCHSTPYYSTLHNNIPMRFLDCTPREERGVLDESDRFMTDPSGFASEFASNWSKPSHVVLFASEERKLGDFLARHSFREIKRFFHAHFKVDRDLQASVVVYAQTS